MISFLSDYGYCDEFVGVVHGVIARIAPEVRVVDVTHGIEPGAVRAGALALTRALAYLPDGVVLAVVDPGVGTDRRAIAVETRERTFIGPDNGLLAPAVALDGGARLIVAVEKSAFRLPSAGSTFDGRDVFAPAAAVLACGEAAVGDLGPPVEGDEVVPLLLPLVEHAADGLQAEILWQDRFGNLQTNASPGDLAAIETGPGGDVTVEAGGTSRVLPWRPAFADVEPGEGVIVTDSQGLVTIAVRAGSAAERFGLGAGTAVVLRGAQ